MNLWLKAKFKNNLSARINQDFAKHLILNDIDETLIENNIVTYGGELLIPPTIETILKLTDLPNLIEFEIILEGDDSSTETFKYNVSSLFHYETEELKNPTVYVYFEMKNQICLNCEYYEEHNIFHYCKNNKKMLEGNIPITCIYGMEQNILIKESQNV